ncbi:MAG TPA: DUF2304 domain-containing protein [Acidobacteriota bacterium]|nr:DUF2304 domain-containing protein [Acidobacteriota bacterium]HQM63405.1 DUF2304 domain-containing protein [Acidobacteriota bacterium]
MTFVQIFTTVINGLLLLAIIHFLRREKLKEKYSLLWLAAIVCIQVLILSEGWLNRLAQLVGIYYPPSLVFYLAILFLFAIMLHQGLAMSKLTRQNQVLAQRLALLEARLEYRSPLGGEEPPAGD